MLQTFEDYCQRLRVETREASQKAEMPARIDHLRAFNFGRSLARMELAQDIFWVRLRCLFWGAAAGVTLAAIYLQVFLGARILPFTK